VHIIIHIILYIISLHRPCRHKRETPSGVHNDNKNEQNIDGTYYLHIISASGIHLIHANTSAEYTYNTAAVACYYRELILDITLQRAIVCSASREVNKKKKKNVITIIIIVIVEIITMTKNK